MNLSARSILKFLASLKLAVIIIIAIGVLSGWGTIVEAQYNSEIATKTVYHSVWMVGTLMLLCVNLIAVIVDRYPWKQHHLGFILAHVGIITLLVGSVITQKYGVDGSMSIPLGRSDRYVIIPPTNVAVWASYDGDSMAKVFEQEVDFYMDPPTEEKPFELPIPGVQAKIVDYMPFALEESKLIASEDKDLGPALRFQLQNDNVNFSDWIHMDKANGSPSVMNLGPAKVVLNRGNYKPTGENEIILKAKKGGEALEYSIHSKRERPVVRGEITSGEAIETGWMGMKLRALKYIPHAEQKVNFIPLERPTDRTRAAVKVIYEGEPYWFSLNSLLKLFTDNAVYILQYANQKVDIGFNLKLIDFRVGRYQGTRRAATYESDVEVPHVGKVNISMNEPMKHNGLTFYQSSFQEDENGTPIASVFSVNHDPGRWTKYLGSFLMVLGTIVMFYFKRVGARRKKAS